MQRRRPLWQLWDPGDTRDTLAEGCEEAMRLAAEGYVRLGRTVLLESPRGKEEVCRPAPEETPLTTE